MAVWIPASGWLGDRFGTKRVFLAALVLFVGGSALCGVAQSIGQLVTFRVLQGVGGGMLTPIGMAMLFRAFPPIERARAATIVMVPTLAAPALGPVLGGLITDTIGWRWIFFVNVPVGLAALVFGLRFLREHTEPGAGRFDVPGFVLSGFGLAAIIFALNEGPSVGWDNPVVVVLGIGGLLAFACSSGSRPTGPNRCSPCACSSDRLFATTNLVMAFSMASFVGAAVRAPAVPPGPARARPVRKRTGDVPAGHRHPRLVADRRPDLRPGRAAPAVDRRDARRRVSVAGFTQLGLDTDLWIVRGLLFARGLAMGFTFVAVQTASYARIAPSDNGRASAIFATQRQMSVSIGVALMATVLSGFTPLHRRAAGSAASARGLSLDVRGGDGPGADRGGHRHPHPRRGRGGDDGRSPAGWSAESRG